MTTLRKIAATSVAESEDTSHKRNAITGIARGAISKATISLFMLMAPLAPCSLEPRHEPQQAGDKSAQGAVGPQHASKPVQMAVDIEDATAAAQRREDSQEPPCQSRDDESGKGS